MIKKNNVLDFIQEASQKRYKDTKNKSVEEKLKYILEGAEHGLERINNAIAEKQLEKISTSVVTSNPSKKSRNCRLLIRLTESERSQLEQEAKQKKISINVLARNRLLNADFS
ncbi:MAG: hypothetical protein LBB88_08250 [Planctomycetaceae bacterium]|jgi:hypothetical protein|nr:hypothetical protein [Planctomycetaceae bacterium]